MIHTEKGSSPGNQTDSNYNEAQSLIIYKQLTIVFVIISIILMSVVMKPKMNYQSTSHEATYSEQKSDENEFGLLGKTTSTKNDSQSVVSHPVQEESVTRENKPSSTKPF